MQGCLRLGQRADRTYQHLQQDMLEVQVTKYNKPGYEDKKKLCQVHANYKLTVIASIASTSNLGVSPTTTTPSRCCCIFQKPALRS
jgi:hypothetical protein